MWYISSFGYSQGDIWFYDSTIWELPKSVFGIFGIKKLIKIRLGTDVRSNDNEAITLAFVYVITRYVPRCFSYTIFELTRAMLCWNLIPTYSWAKWDKAKVHLCKDLVLSNSLTQQINQLLDMATQEEHSQGGPFLYVFFLPIPIVTWRLKKIWCICPVLCKCRKNYFIDMHF